MDFLEWGRNYAQNQNPVTLAQIQEWRKLPPSCKNNIKRSYALERAHPQSIEAGGGSRWWLEIGLREVSRPPLNRLARGPASCKKAASSNLANCCEGRPGIGFSMCARCCSGAWSKTFRTTTNLNLFRHQTSKCPGKMARHSHRLPVAGWLVRVQENVKV